MSKKMQANKVIRGSFGRLWMNDEMMSNVKSFEAKTTMKYEEVEISGDLATHQRYMGYAIEGTMTLHKIDSQTAALISEGIVNGDMPDITLIGKVDDPTSYGCERYKFSEVTFDEVTLMKFANKEIGEEEIPFKAAYFKPLDLIK